MFSPYEMGQKHAQEGLAQPQARHAGDASASLEQACELAGVTRGKPGTLSTHTQA